VDVTAYSKILIAGCGDHMYREIVPRMSTAIIAEALGVLGLVCHVVLDDHNVSHGTV